MRFSDIKKFWETHLGGQSSKTARASTSTTAAKSSRKSELSRAKKSNLFLTKDRSISSRVASYNTHASSNKNELCKNTRAHSALDCLALPSDTKTFNPTQSSVINDGIAEEKVESIDSKADEATSSSHRLNSEESSFAEQCLNKNQTETNLTADAANQFIESYKCEGIVLTDKAGSFSKKKSLKKSRLFVKNTSNHSSLVKSENNLDALPFVKAGVLSPGSDSTSAPPSMYNSPRKTMDASIAFLRSNMKFNDVQNFWLMKEKQLLQRSMEDRM